MIERVNEDRRVVSKKTKVENRENRRRKEDIDNIKAYYIIFTFLSLIIMYFGISALVH